MNTGTSTTVHTAAAKRRVGSKTYRAVCSCGFVGSNTTKSQAERRAERHQRTGA